VKGRKPKPSGMSSRRPRRSADARTARLPVCPPHLQGEARKEWRRLGKKLVACGLLTEIDGTALALYCQAWARWTEAEANLLRYGTVIKAPSGYPMASPYLSIANTAMTQMTRLLVEFGMTPSSRSRVAVVPPAAAPATRAVPTQDEEDPRLLLFSDQSTRRPS
jgi:P27 family predicted phage terminase small subunit